MVCVKNISACLCCYVVVLWFSWSVLMKCFTRGIHWGAAHTTCRPRLGKWIYRNHFSDMTLNVQSERVKWKWDFMALHYQCCSRNWRNVVFFVFFFIAGKIKLLIYGTHKHRQGFTCHWIPRTLLLLWWPFNFILSFGLSLTFRAYKKHIWRKARHTL